MSGGHAADAVQSPSELQPKSKPAMLIPANWSLPALAGGELGAQVPELDGAEDVLEGVVVDELECELELELEDVDM